jgi:formyl-CoA transferase
VSAEHGDAWPADPDADAAGALSGLRVLDASNLIAGPLASTFLADFGADVIKLEAPGRGDSLRDHGRRKDGQSLWWKYLGRNKRSVTLYLGSPEGQALFRRLAASADVVIENFRPGTLARWGIDFASLASDNPGLIMAHVTGFGQVGPKSHRPGFGTLGEALSGFAHRNGQPEGAPTLPPFGLADNVTGIITAYAVMTALWARERTGRGQEIDVAIVESLLPLLEPQITEFDQFGESMGRFGNRSPMNAPRNLYRSADGRWIAVSTSTQTTAERLLGLVGGDEILRQPWFQVAAERAQHADELDEVVGRWIGERTSDEVLARCDEIGAPASLVYTAEDVVNDEQYQALGSVASVPDPVLGTVRMPNVQFRLSETPGRVRWAGADLGAHTDDVLASLGVSESELAELRSKGVV